MKKGQHPTSDAALEAAIIAADGKVGKAARALGVTSKAVVARTTGKRAAKKPRLRGLPARVRANIRRLVEYGVQKALAEGDTRVLVEVMKSKLCRDMELAPDKQEVELTGKVDGDLRLGVLDERAAAARLKALEEAK